MGAVARWRTVRRVPREDRPDDEADLGAALIEMGAGTTTMAIYSGGRFVHASGFALGGHHITMDLARGLGACIADAERIKTLYGTVLTGGSDARELMSIPAAGDIERDTPQVISRATIANMSPEFGATTTLFPVDATTIGYLRTTGRSAAQLALVETYAKAQGLWRLDGAAPDYDEVIAIDLASIVPSLAGPRRPQDRLALPNLGASFAAGWPERSGSGARGDANGLRDGAIAIAAITSTLPSRPILNTLTDIASGMLWGRQCSVGRPPPKFSERVLYNAAPAGVKGTSSPSAM